MFSVESERIDAKKIKTETKSAPLRLRGQLAQLMRAGVRRCEQRASVNCIAFALGELLPFFIFLCAHDHFA